MTFKVNTEDSHSNASLTKLIIVIQVPLHNSSLGLIFRSRITRAPSLSISFEEGSDG